MGNVEEQGRWCAPSSSHLSVSNQVLTPRPITIDAPRSSFHFRLRDLLRYPYPGRHWLLWLVTSTYFTLHTSGILIREQSSAVTAVTAASPFAGANVGALGSVVVFSARLRQSKGWFGRACVFVEVEEFC